jgi:FlaA1/EpsC-like NDP-sugar epimerase
VLISTDKAVRPTSIMGATKRIAEEIICGVADRAAKPYVSVRFGNVLGSRGSVVPTFIRQIAAGGPITITHPEMRRYFMTIPEAVQLVLQAAAMGRGGEVFALDMGEPVRIADLAEDLIRLSGLEVGRDIEIEFTGTRPGEKLYEEIFFGPQDATPTSHPKVLRARDGKPTLETEFNVHVLIEAAYRRAPESDLRRMISDLVPEYTGPTPVVSTTTRPTPLVPQHQPHSPAKVAKPARIKTRDEAGQRI